MRAVRPVALKRMPAKWARLWIVCEESGYNSFMEEPEKSRQIRLYRRRKVE